jgi:hypothetical protein
MYATYDSNYLYFAIALGNINAGYGGVGHNGDIGLSLDSGTTYAYGIATIKQHTDQLDQNYNTAHGLTPGNLYLVDAWTPVDFGKYVASGDVRIDTYNKQTGDLGLISYSSGLYTGLGFYLIEVAIPLSWLNGDVNMIHITQTCGNDVGNLQVARVPEPSTLLFLGIGLLSLAGMGRRWVKNK